MQIKMLDISSYNNRKELRNYIINVFLKEEPGMGKKELSSKYRCNVEVTKDNKQIYLMRPAHLNKGMDFIVRVKDKKFFTKNMKLVKEIPSHFSIIHDLQEKKKENSKEFKKIYNEIRKIYNLDNFINTEFNFQTSKPCDMILYIIKWLFIE